MRSPARSDSDSIFACIEWPNQCTKGARKCGSIGNSQEGVCTQPAWPTRWSSLAIDRMSAQPPTCSMTEFEWTRSTEASG